MNKKYLIPILFLFTISTVFSQQQIVNATYAIVDTSESKLEQAKSIYDWITNTIEYDTKQLDGKAKYYSPIQTLKRKKAICYGYSELYHSMCKVLDIESYIIHGYSKGFGYIENDPFYKANHAWNIIHIDTSWILVDATWGSGSLSYEYGFLTKLKQVVKQNYGVKDKIEFTQSPSKEFFNISPKQLIYTHFPLDAKWQLTNYPLSYNSFISGEYQTIGFIDYEKYISSVKYLDVDDQVFVDALNSVQYNPYNKFDIAYQNYSQASKLIINKKSPLDTVLLKKIYRSQSYFDSALFYLKEFKDISRNFYFLKKQDQKSAYSIGIKSLKQINRIPTTINGRYDREFNAKMNKEDKLNKIAASIYPLGLHIKRKIVFSYKPVEHADSLEIEEYSKEIETKNAKIEVTINELTQIKKSIEEIFALGKGQNDTLTKYVRGIVYYQFNLWKAIDSMNEHASLKACRDLGFEFSKYDSVIRSKRKIEGSLVTSFNKMNKKYEVAERNLYSILRNYDKLAKITGNNEHYSEKANETNAELYDLYKLKIETVQFLKIHNESWIKLLTEQNQIFEKNGLYGYSVLSSKLESFYKFISDRNSINYSNDMDTYTMLRTDSKNRGLIMKKISKEIEKHITN